MNFMDSDDGKGTVNLGKVEWWTSPITMMVVVVGDGKIVCGEFDGITSFELYWLKYKSKYKHV